MTRIRIRALLLLAALALGGCTDTPPAPPSISSTSPSSPSSATPAVRLVEITVSGRNVSPPPGRVDVAKGEVVRLVVHSGTADEIHVHGYDLEAAVGPGRDAVIEFAADQAGLFEVETHDSGLLLTQLAVR